MMMMMIDVLGLAGPVGPMLCIMCIIVDDTCLFPGLFTVCGYCPCVYVCRESGCCAAASLMVTRVSCGKMPLQSQGWM